ncbi:deoxyribonuclease IV [Acholeplasma sp. OttesenSCG-928-E16]|nr:deoxyribonuclease IV [Acholeplasma sp. OttesenSCG-928-E16]
MLKIGSHVSLSAPNMYLGSVMEALSYGANCLMVYTGAPQNTIRRPLSEMKINEAIDLMNKNGITKNDIVVHAPYIINLANPDEEKRSFAVDFLTKEIKRSFKMNAKQIVLHPGSAVGKDLDMAIKWIADGLNKVIKNTEDLDVLIALETMAGKGNEVGRSFEELKRIIDLVQNKSRISICFDTCHTSDAGYDIKDNFDTVISEFDKIIGKEKISVFHINDSKNLPGAKKDRHANFGFGEIGFQSLLDVIYHKDFVNIPKILETPYVSDKPPYRYEIKMILEKKFNKNLISDILEG